MQTLDNLRQARADLVLADRRQRRLPATRTSSTASSRRTCEERGWEYRIEHTSIGDVMDDILESRPPLLAVRPLRRGVLYRIATEVGATKIALGHPSRRLHRDAAAEPVLRRALKAMPARLVSDNGEHVVIRPLAYVGEDEAGCTRKESACRSSAAAARRAAISACSASASSG
jgi:tRNA(Ile)-lysidine synthase TilS/MesJ